MRPPAIIAAASLMLSAMVGSLLGFVDRPPVPQLTVPCQIVRVIDGDTVEVEIRTRFNVRLLDCWAPEKHQTAIAGEKALGIASADAMRLLAEGKPGTVAVPLPADPEASLASVFTLGRVLGHVTVEAGDLAKLQRDAGHAYATKAELIDGMARAPPAK